MVGIIAAAENMVAGNAYRPNDIVTTYSGKTVEIISTDAEGRLVLADALTYAQRTYEPRALIDIATLTGGASIALAQYAAALFATDDQLARRITESGRRTHERVWRLPMWDDYLELIKGTDSDLVNAGKTRAGHCIQGAIFLRQFIDDGTSWAHLDIASAGIAETDSPLCPKGATGFGVRLLLDMLGRQR